MNLTLHSWEARPPRLSAESRLNDFRQCFQRSLLFSVRRGALIEESFGRIWNEVLDQIELNEQQEAQLYAELLQWARHGNWK